MKTTRSYTMTRRAAAVQETRRRILDAMFTLTSQRLLADIGLDDVAESAGVSVQTVLRQFGSRAGLIEATGAYAAELVRSERQAPAGDTEQWLAALLEHYERRGDGVVLLLAQEGSDETVARITEEGRRRHRAWVDEAFSAVLEQLSGPEREACLDLLVVATDVYTWKLLRRDRGLSRDLTLQRVSSLVTAVLASAAVPTTATGRH